MRIVDYPSIYRTDMAQCLESQIFVQMTRVWSLTSVMIICDQYKQLILASSAKPPEQGLNLYSIQACSKLSSNLLLRW